MRISGLLAALKRSWLPLLVAIGLSIAAIAASIPRNPHAGKISAVDPAHVYPAFADVQIPSETTEAVKD
ncbi:hypothetical protein [Hyphomicrobium sp. CS1GBMeth3]|uniref:hypothetical protein n=1 Tax=Hyphomicrobium sp. CS1GBMeth3 TaxID=1892845 RepID=UPI000930C940|nr:hypothetical protein [Hyphomicrobium sp. CS1GBMeth3]